MKTSVFRKVHFNAAHRLHNPSWSDEKNKAIFGLCNNPNYHGHNFELVVCLTGEVDPETGYVFDLKILNDILKKDIVDQMDHKNLNLEVAAFKDLNPTAENIARVIYEIVRNQISIEFDVNITLFETERNYVQYPA